MNSMSEQLKARIDRVDERYREALAELCLEFIDRKDALWAELQVGADEIAAGKTVPWEGKEAFLKRMRAKHEREREKA